MSTGRLAAEMNISRTSAQCLLRKDLRLFLYKGIKQQKLTNLQKKEKNNWVSNSYRKEDINRGLFYYEILFYLDGIYNARNDRIWTPSREEADKRGAIYEKTQFLVKVMVWLGVRAQGFTTSVMERWMPKDTLRKSFL